MAGGYTFTLTSYQLYNNAQGSGSWHVTVAPSYEVAIETSIDGKVLDFAKSTQIVGTTKQSSIFYTFKPVLLFFSSWKNF